jgi:hypothetical protein
MMSWNKENPSIDLFGTYDSMALNYVTMVFSSLCPLHTQSLEYDVFPFALDSNSSSELHLVFDVKSQQAYIVQF